MFIALNESLNLEPKESNIQELSNPETKNEKYEKPIKSEIKQKLTPEDIVINFFY